MNYCGYHSHTTFSDGKNTPREMIEAAISLGMPAIGITDHSFTACDPSYCMHEEQYPAYIAELTALKAEYADRITVMRGLELDADSNPAITSQLDYFLGSVHYLCFGDRVYAIDHAKGEDGADNQRECIQNEFGGNKLAFAQAYYDKLVAHIHKTKPTIIGHVDVITKFGLFDAPDAAYEAIVKDALDSLVTVTPVMEVNTGAISRNWRDRPYPADFALRHWHGIGGEVILGADTHAATTIDCAFPLAIECIKAAGYDHLLILDNDGFHKQAI